MDWLTHHYADISEAEQLEEAIHDWLSATGDWRCACRNDVRKRVARMRDRAARSHAELHAAYVRANRRREMEALTRAICQHLEGGNT